MTQEGSLSTASISTSTSRSRPGNLAGGPLAKTPWFQLKAESSCEAILVTRFIALPTSSNERPRRTRRQLHKTLYGISSCHEHDGEAVLAPVEQNLINKVVADTHN